MTPTIRVTSGGNRENFSDAQLVEEIGGILGLMDFQALGGLAHGLSCEFVRLQVEGQGLLPCHPGQNDAHQVGDREAHFFEHGGSLLFYVSADSGADNGICGHAYIVAQLSHNMRRV